MRRNKPFKISKLIKFLIIAFVLIGIVAIKIFTYKATDDFLKVEDKTVTLSTTSDYIKISPNVNNNNIPPILFYNGALVENKAYIPLAKKLAKEGFSVYLIKTPINLPILSSGKAIKIVEKENLEKYILMGHSLGGVIASSDVKKSLKNNDSNILGLILLSSYPSEKTDLKEFSNPVLSFVPSNDKVLNRESFEKSKERLPLSTKYVEILGGNHAGYGNYGAQKGDGKAEITNDIQQDKVVETIQIFLGNIKE